MKVCLFLRLNNIKLVIKFVIRIYLMWIYIIYVRVSVYWSVYEYFYMYDYVSAYRTWGVRLGIYLFGYSQNKKSFFWSSLLNIK